MDIEFVVSRRRYISSSRLNHVNASLAKSLAQEQENAAITVLNQKYHEIERLTAKLTRFHSKVEDANKARDDAVRQVVDKAAEVKELEEIWARLKGTTGTKAAKDNSRARKGP